MPDPVLMLQAMLVALAIGMAAVGLGGWLVHKNIFGPAWSSAAAIVGLGLGFCAGCFWLGVKPHWPPREDQDRLLEVVMPAVVLIELLSTCPAVPRWSVQTLRVAVAFLTARVLLHGTSYLEDLAGPGTREWSPVQSWLILVALGLALVASWASIVALTRRTPTASPVLPFSGVIAAAALTIMMSGYATGGQIGLPLAAALAGVALSSLLLPSAARPNPPIGVGIVGLFSLLVVGRFFGQLSTTHAILLMAAPLLAWVPELPYLKRLPGWARGLSRLGLVAALAIGVLVHAQQQFTTASATGSAAGAREATVQDYMNLGR